MPTGPLADTGACRAVQPARRLYDRLGFQQIADQDVYLLLEWKPTPGTSYTGPASDGRGRPDRFPRPMLPGRGRGPAARRSAPRL